MGTVGVAGSNAGRSSGGASTRERILDSALDLFVEVGFSVTTISDVERRVGLAAGTGSFYRHFRSKDDLLRVVVEREVARYVAVIAEERDSFAAVDDPQHARVVLLQRMLRGIRRFDRLFRLMLSEGDRVPELGETITEALENLWEPVSWEEHPTVVMLLSALGGYYLFGSLQARPFLEVPDDEFISALAALMGDWTAPTPAAISAATVDR